MATWLEADSDQARRKRHENLLLWYLCFFGAQLLLNCVAKLSTFRCRIYNHPLHMIGQQWANRLRQHPNHLRLRHHRRRLAVALAANRRNRSQLLVGHVAVEDV
jgi:hypothetical protein